MPSSIFVEDFQPRSELVVPEHQIPRARFPVVDAHNHLTHPGFGWDAARISQTLREMDSLNIAAIINLSGGTGDELKRNIEKLDQAHPGRFVTFCNTDFSGVDEPGWSERTTSQLQADVQAGARGLKVFKQLGLGYRDSAGKLISPDDERLSDLWDSAGELGIPVTIHSADPVAFFRPLDRFNERWDELHAVPDWLFHGSEFPSFEELIDSLYRLIEAHPRTNFITAHVGCYAENLGFVSRMMDTYPNLYTDISARIAELGRAPFSARKWFVKYADRILFGTDSAPRTAVYQTYFRFLETADEYFKYSDAPIPGQGRWNIYGVDLPDDVLEKVYSGNAKRLLRMEGAPGVRVRLRMM